MKDELINEVQRRMLPYLNNEQLLRLKDALDVALYGLTVSNSETVPQQKERDPLEAFITAKRIEGCSGKTLLYYRKTIEAMIVGTVKSAHQVTTDDLLKYLTNYQTQLK